MVDVLQPDGQASFAAAVKVVPQVTGVNPDPIDLGAVPFGGQFTLTLTGQGFVDGFNWVQLTDFGPFFPAERHGLTQATVTLWPALVEDVSTAQVPLVHDNFFLESNSVAVDIIPAPPASSVAPLPACAGLGQCRPVLVGHCQLCHRCWANRHVRQQYPALTRARRSTDGYDFDGPAAACPSPTKALPRSVEKIAVLRGRAALGQELFHPLVRCVDLAGPANKGQQGGACTRMWPSTQGTNCNNFPQ